MSTIHFLERPIISYVLVIIISVAAAVIFFLIGGSFAEISGQENTYLGFTFEAGGAIAGFVIIFLISLKFIERLREITPEEKRLLKEFVLKGLEPSIDTSTGSINCKYRLYDQENGGWGEWKTVEYIRQGRGLRIYVHEMEPKHIISVKVEHKHSNDVWQPDEDLSYGVTPLVLKKV